MSNPNEIQRMDEEEFERLKELVFGKLSLLQSKADKEKLLASLRKLGDRLGLEVPSYNGRPPQPKE